jgi:hypothetical protein
VPAENSVVRRPLSHAAPCPDPLPEPDSCRTRDGRVLTRPSSRVHEPCNSPEAVPPRVARRALADLFKAEPGAARSRATAERSGAALIHIRPDSAVDQLRAFRMSLREKPAVSQTAPLTTSSYPCAVQAARGGTRPPGCTCRIRRVTAQGRALRAYGPELDDMNAMPSSQSADRRVGRDIFGRARSADCYLKILILSQRLEFMFSNSRQGLPGWPRQATLCQAGGAASRRDPDHDAIGLPVLPAAHTVGALCCLYAVIPLGFVPTSERQIRDVQALDILAKAHRPAVISSLDLGVFAVAATGVLCAFSCVVDALPEQCLRRRLGANPLFAAVFRTKRLLRECCSATCQRRRRPGQARHRCDSFR